MAKMSLGSFVFPHNPSKMPLIEPKKTYGVVETYTNIGYFSWGTLIAGVEFTMEWPFMTYATFASFDQLFKADQSVIFNPQDGTSRTFTVELLELNGEPHVGLGITANSYRKNVKLKCLILNRVT